MSTFLGALIGRYCEAVEEATPEDLAVSLSDRGRQKDTGKKWELVGMEKTKTKQSALNKLTMVSLRGDALDPKCVVKEKGEVTAVCPRIRELDLRDTHSNDWGAIATIASELPSLTSLDVSENPRIEAATPCSGNAFANLNVLVLNSTSVAWSTLCTGVLPHLPVVQELHMEANGLRCLAETAVTPCRTLRLLNCTGNLFSSWGSLLPGLSSFPCLENLVLSANPLESLREGADRVAGTCPHLKAVSLQEVLFPTKHTMWDLYALVMFPHLTSLKIPYEPFFPPGLSHTTCRLIVIGQVPSLTSLNGSVVRPKERTEGEKLYIGRAYMAESEEGGGGLLCDPPFAPEVTAKYPLLERYVATHGLPANGKGSHPGASATLTRKSSVSITLRCVAKKGLGKADKTQPIPLATKVSQLKGIVKAVFGIEVQKQRLLAWETVTKDKDVIPSSTELKEDHEDLMYYSVQEGMLIEVHDTE